MKGKKLSDGVSLGGRGRLTDKTVDKIQNFYGQAIRANPGDLKGMVDSIWAIYYHMIKSTKMELPEQHQYYLKGDASWCKYWSNRESYEESRRLAPVFLEVLKPIFKDLTNENLLGRCMLGLTQNQNEAINSEKPNLRVRRRCNWLYVTQFASLTLVMAAKLKLLKN